jgi:uncharacterized protein
MASPGPIRKRNRMPNRRPLPIPVPMMLFVCERRMQGWDQGGIGDADSGVLSWSRAIKISRKILSSSGCRGMRVSWSSKVSAMSVSASRLVRSLLVLSLLVLSLLALSFNATGPARSQQSGFDCARKSTPDEITICGDASLTRLDGVLGTLYAAAGERLDDGQKAALRDSQRAWMRRRAACGSDAGCIETLYSERIPQLQALVPSPPAQPSFDCARKSAPDEITICGDAALARLDGLAGALYAAAGERLDDSQKAALRDSQRAWMRQRAACGSNAGCIETLYSERIPQLQAAVKEIGAAVGVTAGITDAVPVLAGRRIALVVGISAYMNVAPLRNPAADARAVADAFRRLGFAEVIEREDLTRADLEKALKDFGDKVTDSDWAVIYYAGHGVEMNGENYLVPVDAKLDRADHVEDETVSLRRVLSKTEAAHKLRMVILDACRSNPFRMASVDGHARAIGRGLSPVEPAGGVLVAYAARGGTIADDGSGNHSPFTQALLANMETPGLDIRIMFSKVRDQVLSRTNNTQEPFTYGSLPGEELYFKQAVRR